MWSILWISKITDEGCSQYSLHVPVLSIKIQLYLISQLFCFTEVYKLTVVHNINVLNHAVSTSTISDLYSGDVQLDS
jgi:hypothetical protein